MCVLSQGGSAAEENSESASNHTFHFRENESVHDRSIEATAYPLHFVRYTKFYKLLRERSLVLSMNAKEN